MLGRSAVGDRTRGRWWRAGAAGGAFAGGILSAVALAGCGGGQVADKASTGLSNAAVTRTTPATTAATTGRAEAIGTTSEATVTEVQTTHETVAVTETATVPAPAPTTAPAPAPAPVVTTATTPTATIAEAQPSSTPTAVWIAIVLALVALVAAAVWGLVRHHRGPSQLTPAARAERVFSAVNAWTAQGWAVEREDDASAVLVRDGERMLVAVDPQGRVTSTRADAPPGGRADTTAS